MNLHYFWWIPVAVIYYSFYAYLSKFNNELGGKWFFIVWAYSIFSGFLWCVVSRISDNLLFDDALYANVLFLSAFLTLYFLGCGGKMVFWQYVGVVLLVVGSVLMRVGGKVG